MSSDRYPIVSESRQRARAREAERQRQKEERRAARSGSRGSRSQEEDEDDPLAEEREKWRARQRAAAADGSTSYSRDNGMDGEGGMMTREDELIMHAQQLQEENKETLKNTIRVARDTAQVGASTINKLNEQTEQFERMDRTLDETSDTLSRSERILKGMKSWGGAISNMFSSGKTKKAHPSAPPRVGDTRRAPRGENVLDKLEQRDRERAMRQIEEEERERGRQRGTKKDDPASHPFRTPGSSTDQSDPGVVIPPNAKQKSAIDTMRAHEREEDAALDELSDVLGALKDQSMAINQQLTLQSNMIDGIETKVDQTAMRLQKGSRTMKQI